MGGWLGGQGKISERVDVLEGECNGMIVCACL